MNELHENFKVNEEYLDGILWDIITDTLEDMNRQITKNYTNSIKKECRRIKSIIKKELTDYLARKI